MSESSLIELQVLRVHLLENTFFTEHLQWLLLTVSGSQPATLSKKSLSDHLFYKPPLGNCLFHLQVAEFQPPHIVKKYFTSAFQAFYQEEEVAIRKVSCTQNP